MALSVARIARQRYGGNYNQTFGRAAFGFTTKDYSFFVQDDYRLSSRLTLNLGLRYEYQQLPRPQVPNLEAVKFCWDDIRARADAELSIRKND